MHALTYRGDRTIKYESISDPKLQAPSDVIVKVKLCAICGSDLHVYHGHEKGCDHGTAMGHEFVGEVVETGSEVSGLRSGDRVMSPFSTSCGQCTFCLSGLTSRCVHSQLFGWVQENKGLNGGQAEYLRVPYAEGTLIKIPDSFSFENALLLGDIIPTGYFCAWQADIKPEGVYVVVGCGAVGLMAVLGAIELGAKMIYAVDTLSERLKIAEAFGAIPINASVHDPVKIIHQKTKGIGVDGVLEAVGNNNSLRLAYNLVRPGGIISMVGVNNESTLPFSPADAYNKNLTFKVGRCPARFFMDKLLPIVASGKYDYASVVTHRMELKDGVSGYEMFAGKKDNCVKVVLSV